MPKLTILGDNQLATIIYDKTSDYTIDVDKESIKELNRALDVFLRKKV